MLAGQALDEVAMEVAALEDHQLLGEELLDADLRAGGQRMIVRQADHHFLAQEVASNQAMGVGAELILDDDAQVQLGIVDHPAQAQGAALDHAELDVGIACLECHQQGREVVGAEHRGDADAHLALDQPLELGHRQCRALCLLQQGAGMLEQRVAGRCQAQTA